MSMRHSSSVHTCVPITAPISSVRLNRRSFCRRRPNSNMLSDVKLCSLSLSLSRALSRGTDAAGRGLSRGGGFCTTGGNLGACLCVVVVCVVVVVDVTVVGSRATAVVSANFLVGHDTFSVNVTLPASL